MSYDEKWEYCSVYLGRLSWEEKELRPGEKKQRVCFCELYIKFFGDASENVFIDGKDRQEPAGKAYRVGWPYNPYEKALYLLGNAGWEMVNFQAHDHGEFGDLSVTNALLYFKRRKMPDLPGEKVNFPFTQEALRFYGDSKK